MRLSVWFAVLALAPAAAVPAPETAPPERLEAVAARGAGVMPFDLERTRHHFVKDARGGVQRVVAKDASDAAQVASIRAHLERIAADFARGDFGAPEAIHGADMPGLDVLRAAGARLEVDYAPLADGARVAYRSHDADVVAAIHRWFDAQLRDHGHHAHGH
jgi:hypothetical protein